jgi:hypothetical protein
MPFGADNEDPPDTGSGLGAGGSGGAYPNPLGGYGTEGDALQHVPDGVPARVLATSDGIDLNTAP